MNDPQTTRPRAPELALLELPGGEQGAAIARSWGRSLPSALACALLVFVAVGSLNVYANPRGEFPTSNVPPLPEQEAAYKMWLVEGLPAPPRTVVLGSSWMQKIDPDVVEAAGAGAAFNFAVAGAHPVDLVDLADALDGRGRFPQALLVGVDENRLAEPPPHFRPSRYVDGPLHDSPSAQDWLQALAPSLTYDYVQESVTALRWDGVQRQPVWFEEDGYAHYRPWEDAMASGTFDPERHLAPFRGATETWTASSMDPSEAEALAALVAKAAARGTEVRFVVLPVHPAILQSYGTSIYPAYHTAVVAHLQGLCAPGVHAFDFHSVESFGGSPEGFYDGHHMMPENADALTRAVFLEPGDLCREANASS